MYLETGRPFSGAALERLKQFLAGSRLDYDANIDFSVAFIEDGRIIASGSLDGATLKCIAVAQDHQGEDLCARLLTPLRQEAFARNIRHLMLYTKPENAPLFQSLGFYPLVHTRDCLLMEDQRNGLERFLDRVRRVEAGKNAGCIVANGNPFTLGHRFLVERAARQCNSVYLFILAEDRSLFSPETRLEMARAACADLENVYVCSSGPYMVSTATFPDYFIRDKARVNAIHCELDVRLFGTRIAPALDITRRFVGSEPFCPVTSRYNEALARLLPQYGIDLVQIERMEVEGACVSASRVRMLIQAGNLSAVQTLVPQSSFEIICRQIQA